MSIDRLMQFGDPGCYIWDISCDEENCERKIQAEGTFQEAKEEMAERGWMRAKVYGEFQCRCPECYNKPMTIEK